MNERERILERVTPSPTGCWLWNGAIGTNGYATVSRGTRPNRLRWMAHRFSYEVFVGPIPEGLDLDHLCRVRHCVNPDHLEPVTRRENLLRGQTINALRAAQTHCIHGHEFTPENTYRYADGTRKCRACRASQMRAYHARRRGVA